MDQVEQVEQPVEPKVNKTADIRAYHKSYYAENKEYLLKKAKDLEVCQVCGCSVRKGAMKRHLSTAKCKRISDYYSNKNNE